MREETRRAIAYAAAIRITGIAPTSIYSPARRWRTTMSPGYDVDAQSHINISGSTLYHHGTANRVKLEVDVMCFSGYSQGERQHFCGSIIGNSVEIFDFGEHKYFRYLIEMPARGEEPSAGD
jgi:hypothetical protein